MFCIACKYPNLNTIETKHSVSKNVTRRRRECPQCGLRFTTHEKLKEEIKPLRTDLNEIKRSP